MNKGAILKTKIIYDPELYVPKPYPGDAEGSFVLGTDSDVLQTVLLKTNRHHELEGRVWFGYKTAGPPGHVHGGCQAAILDEMMGSTGWHFGHPVVAAKIEVNFLEMIPYENTYELLGKIEKMENRKIYITAQIFSGDKIYAHSSGLFIALTQEQRLKLDLKS
jgi:acyl-coenzyme A thioesterase PaaI-like protein